jgi:hypothetical protein
MSSGEGDPSIPDRKMTVESGQAIKRVIDQAGSDQGRDQGLARVRRNPK